MRKGLAGLCGLCIVGGLLAGVPLPRASAKASVIDKELLGIRLLQSYKSVLQLYGAPTRIYRADEFVDLINATDANGKETGGIKGVGAESQSGGLPGGGGGGMGRPGSGGMMPGSGGMMPGSGGRMPGSGGMMPGSGGMMGGKGGRGGDTDGGPMMPGGGGGALGGASNTNDKPITFAEAGGFTWVYFYPREELAYIFRFNADGRVEIISEHGRYKGKPSSRGVRLGDPVRAVYNTYGWPDTSDQQINTIALNYNIKHHAQIGTLNGKVVSIAVFLKEDQIPHLISVGGTGGGGGQPMGGGRPAGGGGGGGRPIGGPGRALGGD